MEAKDRTFFLYTCGNEDYELLIKWFHHLAHKILSEGLFYEIRYWPPLEEEDFNSNISDCAHIELYSATNLPCRKVKKSKAILCGKADWDKSKNKGYVLGSRNRVGNKGINLTKREIDEVKKIVGLKVFNEFEKAKLNW